MAQSDESHEHEWVERVKLQGNIPLLNLEDDDSSSSSSSSTSTTTGWASPPGDTFMVRGPDYFKTKVKVPAGDCLLKPLGFDWIKSSTKLSALLSDPSHRIRRAVDEQSSSTSKSLHKPFVWAFNFQLPANKENYNLVAYFVSLEPPPKGSVTEEFLKRDDCFRNSRLKLVVHTVKGPWIVKKAVGNQAICIIGKELTCKYSLGENFMEVDIDVASSMVATAIFHVAFGYFSKLCIDIAFLIECQTEPELPERVLGAFRFSGLHADSVTPFESAIEGSASSLRPSHSVRLLKSLGQSFSHIVHKGAQENVSELGPSQVNGAIYR